MNNRKEGFAFLTIKIYHKAVMIKLMLHWHRNRKINQWNKEPRNIYGAKIFSVNDLILIMPLIGVIQKSKFNEKCTLHAQM